MRLLDLSMDIGPGATPAHLEALVKGLRVATDLAYEVEVGRVQRAATERMKFPTDAELRQALDRLPGDGETGPQSLARRQLAARRAARKELGNYLPGTWFDYLYRRGPGSDKGPYAQAGYDRVAETVFPFGAAVGLDVIAPALYEALVADDVSRNLPEPVGVRQLNYQNPFWASLFGKGKAEKTISTTAQVIEVARDFSSKRKIGQADAAVAQATVPHRVAESDLDLALKHEQLYEARLRNERRSLENARLRQTVGAEEQRQLLIDHAIRRGDLAIGEALRALQLSEVEALGQLGHPQLELNEHDEPDE